jgi:dTDP-4-dehydrorhamnose reductase
VREFKPDIIVNAAAYTAVDRAESEPELALAINGIAPGILAEEARRANALLVHYSTDYVFDGAKSGAYVENDVTHPSSVYGRTKLAGEKAVRAAGGAHLIFRTSWVYGNHGANFMKTMLRLAKESDHLRVVADQVGAPTSNTAIAQATARCLARYLAAANSRESLEGVYHMTCAGQTSWHGFATKIFTEFLPQSDLKRLKVEAIATEDYPTPATRPCNSVLSNAKLLAGFGVGLPDWRSALHEVRASA